ncbi:MAG: hypothetical protein K2P41_01245 [Lachnospiraceae bacterium]|jgi:hypothetical protein|nr:hypothetical protein [uncultured Acetatifactor sp.]MDE6993043.1 hypothetical protein [Lachnospiraceae bacterium]
MDSTPGSKMDLYARAAATLYGIISFDNFCKILDVYYGEGTLSRKRIMAYFWTSDNDDPIYYIQDELIVHASIFPDEIASTLSDIQRSKLAPASRCYRVLPQKEFLRYANPFFYEDTCGTRQMEEYLTDNLGISQKDAEEIVAEMVFVCRCGASPTLVQDALTRRGLPFGRECYLDLITIACEMEPEIRRWEGLGYTGNEVG